jgi:DNA repair protein RecO (recombination protein O)
LLEKTAHNINSMYLKTRAIILHCVKYSDKAIIVHFISEERGRLAGIVYSTSGKKHGHKMAYLQPLSLVELEIEMRPDKELHRIKESKPAEILTSISADPVKNALTLFLAEFLFRTIRETQTDRQLYRFLHHSIVVLEQADQGMANFHLALLLHLTRFLGFFPNAESIGSSFYFDMVNGIFTSACPLHHHFLRPAESAVLYRLMRINYENMHLFRFSRNERNQILEYMLSYYRIHLSEFGELKSLPVLTELFD